MAKTPGSGRKRGTPNKRTQLLQEKCEEMGVDPFDILLNFVKGDWKALGYEAGARVVNVTEAGTEIWEDTISAELRAHSAKEACQYLYPKRKAIEHTVEPNPYEGKDIKELEKMVKEKLEK